MPARERPHGVGHRAFLHPGLVRPLGDPDDGEEVDPAATVDRVVQQVAARTGPELQRRRIGQRRHVLDRYKAAIPHRAGVPPADLAGHVRADHRVHAVGSDDQVGAGGRAVGEPQLDARTALVDTDAAPSQVQSLLPEAISERRQQRDAVDAVVRRAVSRLVGPVATHGVVGDDLAALPAPDDERRRDDRHRLDLLPEPEPGAARACRWPTARRRRRSHAARPPARRPRNRRPARAARARDQPTDPAADDRGFEPRHRVRLSRGCGPGRARSRT